MSAQDQAKQAPPSVQPQFAAPTVQPQYGAPMMQPQYAAPMMQQQYGAPMMQPQYATPMMQPQYGAPMMQPQYQVPGMVSYGAPMGPYGASPVAQPMMIVPGPPPTYRGPPGLYLLEPLNSILIHQEIEIMEIIAQIETENRYKVMSGTGMPLYTLREHSDCCNRQMLSSSRPFQATMTDFFGNTVLIMERDCPCQCCGIPIAPNEVRVSTGANESLGCVTEKCSCITPQFDITDASGVTILRIEGPVCTQSCCSDVEFPVVNTSGTIIGMITKKWGGYMKEAYTDADTFGVQFPVDLDIKVKALLIGASLLIDFMFYEQPANQGERGHRHHHGGW